MKRFATIIALAFIAQLSYAQPVDTKAKGILDQVSTKTKAYKTIRTEVTYTLNNKKDGVNSNKNLKVWIKGAKYRIDTGDQLIVSDGKTVWKYFKDDNEVEVSNPDPSEDGITPNNMFSIYEKGFKYKFVKEEVKSGKTTYIIDLFPLKPKEKDYTAIKVFIDKATMRINSAEMSGKNGSTYSYKIKTFTPNETLGDDLFSFDKTKFPKVVINDVR
ncbi:MAG: outer membrane lipoprotein carrier protein LolA [Sphingobacteriales bacterium JAD_PAG50586_3]|nr:MAG: outer membrane lipoprotein carrier protein LolA [Sphingobacteriales bacterium JAD_PAG50586_3]